ncbi:hypothetical protein [Limnohabitans sp. B9-3]|uniref:hypothetical protein n=1 Tax=Limnohabitans sp. B9-3 TaxID=1100707 RepID=UPI00117A3870|nr:hypothetical protein [Limnohabitans sp. B9-3]
MSHSSSPWTVAPVKAVATVAIQPAAELTAAQKRFNTLLARVSALSDSIATLEALSTQHRSSHLTAMSALKSQEDAARKNLLLYLDGCLHQADLNPKHRRSATQIILGLCEALAHKNDGQVQAVFNQHHSEEDAQALAEEARAGAEHAKAVFEDLFGKPLHGADDLHTAEAVFEAGLRQYREQQQRLEDKRQAKKAKKKPAARQLKDAQQKMDANTALRTVYRQLASALHPDREPDETERLRKTALMSEVNAAYDRKNLSELLKLQLQLAQIDSAALSRIADDKLNAMCLLLKEQVEALEEDEAQAQFEIRHYLGVNDLDHISAESLARALAIQLRDKEHEVDTLERDLRRIQSEAELKRWLKEQAQLAKEARAELTDLDRLLYR